MNLELLIDSSMQVAAETASYNGSATHLLTGLAITASFAVLGYIAKYYRTNNADQELVEEENVWSMRNLFEYAAYSIISFGAVFLLATSIFGNVIGNSDHNSTASRNQPSTNQVAPQFNPIPTPQQSSISCDLPPHENFGQLYDGIVWQTQGPHGFSYGHNARDYAQGRYAPIFSPIGGCITENYIDDYGNTTLVIENQRYKVTLLHGNYHVKNGERIKAGEQVGIESNNGYTMDMDGNLCNGRANCGNHTHINIYDKIQGKNVDPALVLPIQN